MTLMDFALSAAVCFKAGKLTGMPAISMSMDFFQAGKLGEWIWADVEALKLTRTMGFAQGIIRNEAGEALMRCSGNFKLPKDLTAAEGIAVSELLKLKGLS